MYLHIQQANSTFVYTWHCSHTIIHLLHAHNQTVVCSDLWTFIFKDQTGVVCVSRQLPRNYYIIVRRQVHETTQFRRPRARTVAIKAQSLLKLRSFHWTRHVTSEENNAILTAAKQRCFARNLKLYFTSTPTRLRETPANSTVRGTKGNSTTQLTNQIAEIRATAV